MHRTRNQSRQLAPQRPPAHAPSAPSCITTAVLLAAGLLTGSRTVLAADAPTNASSADTIVVTAQKRAESIDKVPLSVSAIRGESLVTQGANDVTALGQLAPGAQFTKNAAGETVLTIRGIGSTDVSETGDPNVAFNLDGVYIGRPAAIAGVLYDIDRVELLRGPQGTLYGRNATSGSVNIITRAPVLGAFGGSAAAEIGNYSAYTLFGALNVPLGERFALRAAVQRTKRDGWGQNAPGPSAFDDDQTAARLRGKWAVSETLTVNAGIDYATQKGVGPVATRLPLTGDPYAQPVQNDPNNLHLDRRNEGAYLQVDWDLPFATLTYIGAHRTNDRDDVNGTSRFFGPSPSVPAPAGAPTISLFDNIQQQKQNTHELRLGSDEASSVKWVAGLYHFDEQQHTTIKFRLRNSLSDKPDIRAASDAAFGQATFPVADSWRLTTGLRFTRDRKSQPGGEFGGTVAPLVPAFIAGSDAFNKSWNSTNWKLGVDHDVTKTTLVYASAGTGFKSGGYRLNGPIASAYEPEKVTALEAGMKAALMDGLLQLSAAVFRNDYRDFQVSSITEINGNPATIVINAPKAVTQGVEFEGVLRPDAAWRINAAVGLLDAKYKNFFLPAPGDAFSRGAAADYSGQRMANAPKGTLNLGVEYRLALAGGALTPRLQTHYESAKNVDYHGFPVTAQDSFTKTDAMLTYEAPGRAWSLLAYVRNIENKAVLSNASPGSPGAFSAERTIASGVFAAPRTVGLRVAADF